MALLDNERAAIAAFRAHIQDEEVEELHARVVRARTYRTTCYNRYLDAEVALDGLESSLFALIEESLTGVDDDTALGIREDANTILKGPSRG